VFSAAGSPLLCNCGKGSTTFVRLTRLLAWARLGEFLSIEKIETTARKENSAMATSSNFAPGNQAIRDPQLTVAPQSGPQILSAPAYNVSIGYLRAFVTLLVLAHHAGIAYHLYAPAPPSSLIAEPRMWEAFPSSTRSDQCCSRYWSASMTLSSWR
jgi:hypothetical protein